MNIIVAAPRFDIATEYSFDSCQKIVDYARAKNCTVTFLANEQAIRSIVESKLNANPTFLFCFYDHGDKESLVGDDLGSVIDLENNSVLTKREVFTMACLSAQTLGADSYWRYGTIYWGSWVSIAFTTDVWDLFRKALNKPMELRIDGETDWNMIMDKTKEHDNQVIDEMIATGAFFAASLMRENRDGRRVWTDKTPPPTQPSTCTFRRTALKLFGQKLGWRIRNPLKS